jgi:hypothetical protein
MSIQSSRTRAAMREFLELNAEERAQFDAMREELNNLVKRGNFLPWNHPDKADIYAAGVRQFQEIHDL